MKFRFDDQFCTMIPYAIYLADIFKYPFSHTLFPVYISINLNA